MAGSCLSSQRQAKLLSLVHKSSGIYLFTCVKIICRLVFGNNVIFSQSGQHKAIDDEGMPHHGRPFMKGRLYIQFNVEFPDAGVLAPDQCRALEKILPPRPSSHLSDMELDESEETTMYDVNIEEEMRQQSQRRQQEAYDEDEDEAPRVQCAQQ